MKKLTVLFAAVAIAMTFANDVLAGCRGGRCRVPIFQRIADRRQGQGGLHTTYVQQQQQPFAQEDVNAPPITDHPALKNVTPTVKAGITPSTINIPSTNEPILIRGNDGRMYYIVPQDQFVPVGPKTK